MPHAAGDPTRLKDRAGTAFTAPMRESTKIADAWIINSQRSGEARRARKNAVLKQYQRLFESKKCGGALPTKHSRQSKELALQRTVGARGCE